MKKNQFTTKSRHKIQIVFLTTIVFDNTTKKEVNKFMQNEKMTTVHTTILFKKARPQQTLEEFKSE